MSSSSFTGLGTRIQPSLSTGFTGPLTTPAPSSSSPSTFSVIEENRKTFKTHFGETGFRILDTVSSLITKFNSKLTLQLEVSKSSYLDDRIIVKGSATLPIEKQNELSFCIKYSYSKGWKPEVDLVRDKEGDLLIKLVPVVPKMRTISR